MNLKKVARARISGHFYSPTWLHENKKMGVCSSSGSTVRPLDKSEIMLNTVGPALESPIRDEEYANFFQEPVGKPLF